MSSAVDLHTSTIFDLRGRVALISGGGTGIGLMIAGGLAANGAKVYIGSRRKGVLQKVADEWATHGRGIIIPYVQSNVVKWLSIPYIRLPSL
jgi:NAD(P)-dependent dehydrogenase (short-subunit alcohol dehydrogenase family)